MPMQLTVSRNRKTSQNFNSEGFGVSVTVELDQGLLGQPDDLQRKIDYLVSQAEQALDRQAAGGQVGTDHHGGNGDQPRGLPDDGDGRNGNGRNGATMTDSQRRAIYAIARRLNVDPAEECRHELGLDLNRLGIREASRMIDHLKAMGEPAGKRGGR